MKQEDHINVLYIANVTTNVHMARGNTGLVIVRANIVILTLYSNHCIKGAYVELFGPGPL